MHTNICLFSGRVSHLSSKMWNFTGYISLEWNFFCLWQICGYLDYLSVDHKGFIRMFAYNLLCLTETWGDFTDDYPKGQKPNNIWRSVAVIQMQIQSIETIYL